MVSQTMSAKGEEWGDSQPIGPPTPTPERIDPFETRKSSKNTQNDSLGKHKYNQTTRIMQYNSTTTDQSNRLGNLAGLYTATTSTLGWYFYLLD